MSNDFYSVRLWVTTNPHRVHIHWEDSNRTVNEDVSFPMEIAGRVAHLLPHAIETLARGYLYEGGTCTQIEREFE